MVKSRPEILPFFEKPRLVDSTFFTSFSRAGWGSRFALYDVPRRPESSGVLFRLAVRPCIFALWDSSEIPKDSKGLLSAWVAGPDSLVHQQKQVFWFFVELSSRRSESNELYLLGGGGV